MKKRFWKIVSAVTAAALCLTLSACSKVSVDENNVKIVENKRCLKVNVTRNSTEYNKAFDRAFDAAYKTQLAREDFEERKKEAEQGLVRDPYDVARDVSARTAHDECSELGMCNVLELEPIENTEYKYWEGTFEVEDIEDAAVYLPILTSRSNFACTVGNTAATMTGACGYEGNFKDIDVELTYDDGTVSKSHMGVANDTLSVSAPAKDGTIEKACYELSLFIGQEGSKKYDMVRITLVKR